MIIELSQTIFLNKNNATVYCQSPQVIRTMESDRENFRALIFCNFQRKLSQECLGELVSVFDNEAPTSLDNFSLL